MKISDTMKFFHELSSVEQTDLIRKIRAQRSVERPRSTRRKSAAEYKPKRQHALEALKRLSPEQVRALLSESKGDGNV